MSRSRRGAWLAALLLAACACADTAEQAGAEAAPGGRARGHDLLLISVDTLRADRLGCYGREAAGTPQIDGLAARGARFDPVTSGTPITLPSHATIMTGLDAPDHGVRHNGTFRLAAEHVTLAERLQDHGYATAAFIGAFVLDARYGLAQGFQTYEDEFDSLPVEQQAMGQYSERPADRVVDSALRWLAARSASSAPEPWFVWVHLFDPHAPYAAPPEYAAQHPDDPYQAEVAFVDAQIGRLVAALEKQGRLESTLIVLVSDHGEGLGQHEEPTHADLIYDSTMRVPWILSNPALFPAPLVIEDRLAGLVDLYPTLLGLLGIAADLPGGGGIDVLSDPADPDRAVYIESMAPLLDYGWAPLRGLRTLEEKLIQAPQPELYRVAQDPGELSNLYGTTPRTAVLRERLAARAAGWSDPLELVATGQAPSREERERLESLGYVGTPERPPEIGVKDPKRMMGLRRRMSEAGELSLRGEHRRAAERIQEVLREDPASAKGWYTALRIFDRAADYERAEASVRRALELSPRAEGWVALARYALNRGDRDEFEHALDEAERLDPLEGGIFIGRGHALAQDREYERALEQFEMALEVDPVRSGEYARRQIERLRGVLEQARGD